MSPVFFQFCIVLLALQTAYGIKDFATCDGKIELGCFDDLDCYVVGTPFCHFPPNPTPNPMTGKQMGCCHTTPFNPVTTPKTDEIRPMSINLLFLILLIAAGGADGIYVPACNVYCEIIWGAIACCSEHGYTGPTYCYGDYAICS